MLPQLLLQLSKYIMIAIALTLVWSAIDSFNHFATHASSNIVIPEKTGIYSEESLSSSLTPLTNLFMNKKATIAFNNFSINADVANTFWSRARGLAGRESLPENEGMLWNYSKPQIDYFWMKGMLFPIDIVWLKKISDTQARVVSVDTNLPPLRILAFVYYFPPEPVDMVLEIQAGLSNAINLTPGSIVDFSL